MSLPVLKFSPLLLPKPWGGDGLWRVLGKGKAGDADMGESWELSDRPGAETSVVEGPYAGQTLGALLRAHGAEILGQGIHEAAHAALTGPGAFPLLYKFIYAREKLSVQVHPGPGSGGEAKTECWVVIDAVPGAELIVGLDRGGKSREEALRLLRSERCGEVLRRLPARKGDAFFIPAGTVHAITEGLLLYEVQQNSDTTYRLHDWGRVDAQGRPRPLHQEEASRVADLEEREGYRIPPLRLSHPSHDEDFLVACPYFALARWSGFRAPATLETRGRFHVLSATSGEVTLRGPGRESTRLERGETVLVPASSGAVRVDGGPDSEFIVSCVPDWEADIRVPLRNAGHPENGIRALSGPPGIRI